ncbi:remorin family protein [Salix suchowensis]|nr:remorin family protein [Salix suchowensis]
MEYERIHKVQSGIISPSKLRMMLSGPHHHRKKDGSNSNSSRTSPSKLQDNEFVKNSLLASDCEDFSEEAAALGLEVASVALPSEAVLDLSPAGQVSDHRMEALPKDSGDAGRVKTQPFSKCEKGNSSAVHPVRIVEDENLDYDSNASSSSFEFHNERSANNQFAKRFSRPLSSKWNDAEKWIMKRQNAQPNYVKKINTLHNQTSRTPLTNLDRAAPQLLSNYDPKSSNSRVADTKLVDFCPPAYQQAFEKFSFIPPGSLTISGRENGVNTLVDQCAQSTDLKEMDQRELSCSKISTQDSPAVPVVRSVCMRDMGTEMTPATSQEPSRTATPVDATTPLRSPTSSVPSTPQRRAPASTPTDHCSIDDTHHATGNGRMELTEQELKLKTRREIEALGVQLGKMNIAAWASKNDQQKQASSLETNEMEENEQIEFVKRAAAWEEAEQSKHTARCKREEIKIQAWESQRKVKLEAEMRRIEARVEQMRAQAHAKMVKKIAMTRQRTEEKRAAAEARKNLDAERTAAQAEYIRQTGRMPSSHYICCGWFGYY